MQQYNDARFTAVVYTHSREFEPFSLRTDDFVQALSYVCENNSTDIDYGIIIDNRAKKTVFRYTPESAWARDKAFEVIT